MITKTVYLAGPITGLSYEECTKWRKDFAASMPDNIVCFSPMRAKQFLAVESAMNPMGYDGHALSTSRGITTRDRNDCMGCDLVLVNLLGAKRVTIGTVMEIAWADAARKPVVLVMEREGNPHEHCMISECVGFRVETLDEAALITKAILLPSV